MRDDEIRIYCKTRKTVNGKGYRILDSKMHRNASECRFALRSVQDICRGLHRFNGRMAKRGGEGMSALIDLTGQNIEKPIMPKGEKYKC